MEKNQRVKMAVLMAFVAFSIKASDPTAAEKSDNN